MPSDPDCIFCKIVAGEIPCHKLYEDERVLAFLDVGPLSRGHTLVIPREHHESLDTLPEALAMACVAVAPRLGRALRAVTGCAGWNLLQNNGAEAGQVVNHVHFHIIPRDADDGLGFRWPAGKLGGDEGRALAETIRARL